MHILEPPPAFLGKSKVPLHTTNQICLSLWRGRLTFSELEPVLIGISQTAFLMPDFGTSESTEQKPKPKVTTRQEQKKAGT